jgi:hypothetical protein
MPLHVDRQAMLRDHPRRLCSIGRTPLGRVLVRTWTPSAPPPAANVATWLRQLVTWLTRGIRLQPLHGAARTVLPVEPAARTNAALAIHTSRSSTVELKCSLKESKEQSSATGIGAASILAGTASAS